MTYKTSLDTTTKVITITITVVFAIIIGGGYFFIKSGTHTSPIYTIVALLAVWGIAFLYRPLRYEVTKDSLIIHHIIRNVRLEMSEVKSIGLLQKSDIGFSFRTFGIGGLFGYFGLLTTTKLGNTTWYATRKTNIVLVQTISNKKIIVTPDNAQEFVQSFNNVYGG